MLFGLLFFMPFLGIAIPSRHPGVNCRGVSTRPGRVRSLAGDKLLMINDLGGTVALFTAPLPPTGDLPGVSASADELPMSGVATASRSQDDKVLAYGLLLMVTEE